tara:strand:- start:5531 stop:5986 length:456 start_codon:yes stop_codon:yes gene_type:complete
MSNHRSFYYRDPINWDWSMTIERKRHRRRKPGRRKPTRKPTHPTKPKCPLVNKDGLTRNQEFREMVIYMELNGWNKKSIGWELGDKSRQYVTMVINYARDDDMGKKTGTCSGTLLLLMREKYKKKCPFPRDYRAALKRQKEQEEFGPDDLM